MLEDGWALTTVPFRRRLPPIKLEGHGHTQSKHGTSKNKDKQHGDMGVDDKKVFFHPATLELSHSYLHCLNALDELKGRGIWQVVFVSVVSW